MSRFRNSHFSLYPAPSEFRKSKGQEQLIESECRGFEVRQGGRYRKGGELRNHGTRANCDKRGPCSTCPYPTRLFSSGNPKSPLADNAQYWIGEAYFAQGDYNRSIIELNEVLLKYPQGDEVPAALLALATAFSTSGDKIDAKLVLQKLISDHPNSEEARIGRQQLQSLAD